MPIPDHQYERDLATISQTAASIHCWLQIIKNASLRTTPSGDRHIDATRQINQAMARIENGLKEYASMVRAVARGESVDDERSA
jgi:hypothetical protein